MSLTPTHVTKALNMIESLEIKMENKSLNAETRRRISAIEQTCAQGLEEAGQTINDITQLKILDGLSVNKLRIQLGNVLSHVCKMEQAAIEYMELTIQRNVPQCYESYKTCVGAIVGLIDNAIEEQENQNLKNMNAGNFGYLRENYFMTPFFESLFSLN